MANVFLLKCICCYIHASTERKRSFVNCKLEIYNEAISRFCISLNLFSKNKKAYLFGFFLPIWIVPAIAYFFTLIILWNLTHLELAICSIGFQHFFRRINNRLKRAGGAPVLPLRRVQNIPENQMHDRYCENDKVCYGLWWNFTCTSIFIYTLQTRRIIIT